MTDNLVCPVDNELEDEIDDLTFAEMVVEDTLSYTEDDEIIFHGPHHCLTVASSENYSKKELRNFYADLCENLEALVDHVFDVLVEDEDTTSWVSVEDSFPKNSQQVVVWNTGTNDTETARYKDGKFLDNSGCKTPVDLSGVVTHWQAITKEEPK